MRPNIRFAFAAKKWAASRLMREAFGEVVDVLDEARLALTLCEDFVAEQLVFPDDLAELSASCRIVGGAWVPDAVVGEEFQDRVLAQCRSRFNPGPIELKIFESLLPAIMSQFVERALG